jgi:hypothetical protein
MLSAQTKPLLFVLHTTELFEGKGPEYILSDAGVEIRKTNNQNLKNLMDMIRKCNEE